MTNADIIFTESLRLMNEGIIAGSGTFVETVNENGEKEQMELPEEIHTYANWKSMGYQVTKGSKAVAQFKIWKHTVKKAKQDGEEDETRMFMTTASFFKASQVEKIQ